MRLVSVGICGPNENYLRENLRHRKSFADAVFIVANNLSPSDQEIIREEGCFCYIDNREWGKWQHRIKADLVEKVRQFEPDWIVFTDMDEFFDSSFNREEAEKLMNKGGAGYHFYIINLWKDEQHYRQDMCFERVSMFKYEPKLGFEFNNQPLCCGLAPMEIGKQANYAPFLIKHYGLIEEKARTKKSARYDKYDPNQKFISSDYYKKINQKNDDPSFNVKLYNELELKNKVAKEYKHIKHKELKMNPSKEYKYINVKITKDNGKELIRQIPEYSLEDTRKSYQKVEVLSEIKKVEKIPEAPKPPKAEEVEEEPIKVEEEQKKINTCEKCGFTAKSFAGLRAHQRKCAK